MEDWKRGKGVKWEDEWLLWARYLNKDGISGDEGICGIGIRFFIKWLCGERGDI